MQRRMFFFVLAVVGLVHAQTHPPEILRSPTPMIDISDDPSPPMNTMSTVPRRQGPDNEFVSVSDLKVPARVRKELEKADESLARRNWTQARDRLIKAISFYPSYAGAYNNLAVAYAHIGDIEQERLALEKAISLDDHFGLAYFNVGRMEVEEKKLSEAEVALNKAATFAPQNPRVFILLAYCQFLEKRFDDAIATSNEAHKLSVPHAVAHRVAARAFEEKREFSSAVAELNLFLQEEPAGPIAEEARKELRLVEVAERE